MNGEKDRSIRNIWVKSSFFLLLIAGTLFFGCHIVSAATAKPVILTQKINDQANTVQIYVPGNHTLYVTYGNKTLVKKYTAAGVKTITLNKQTAGKKITFYLKDRKTGKKSKTVTLTVKKLAVQKQSGKIKKPTVQKTVTSKTTSVSVKGYKGTTLVIKNSQLQTVAKKKFTKTATVKDRKSTRLNSSHS